MDSSFFWDTCISISSSPFSNFEFHSKVLHKNLAAEMHIQYFIFGEDLLEKCGRSQGSVGSLLDSKIIF
jgi:hypothetical protein